MTKAFSFPEWLKGSPQDQDAEQQRQDLLRASFGRAHQTEAERLIGRGDLLEQTARGNLESVKRGDKESRELYKAQLADALAMQGKYWDAARIHPDKVKRKYFRDIVKAIEKPDQEKCSCPDDKAKINDVEIAVTPRFESEKIFSLLHKEVVSVVECSVCGHKNARPLRSRLIPMQAALSANEAVARSESIGLTSDVQVLNGNS